MNTRTMYALLGVLALVIIGLIVYNQGNGQNTALDTQEQTNFNSNASLDETGLTNTNAGLDTDLGTSVNAPVNDNSNTSSNNNTSGQFSDESDLDNGQVYQIAYDGKAYAPSNLTIKVGDTVVFKNNSEKSFWPASANHPEHLKYPEFDAKKAIAPGQSFQFKFVKTGEWGFHDHLNPSAFGKITVQ